MERFLRPTVPTQLAPYNDVHTPPSGTGTILEHGCTAHKYLLYFVSHAVLHHEMRRLTRCGRLGRLIVQVVLRSLFHSRYAT